jgi:oligopeptide/dipeptide ABC transporter ATP-binding protein
MKPLLEVVDLKKHFPIKKNFLGGKQVVKAVDGVNLTIFEGETVSIVGESGCGKSTTGRCILRLIEPSSGKVIFQGKNILDLNSKDLRKIRKEMQIVFQDPFASLNPRKTIRQILMEPLIIHGIGKKSERENMIEEIIEKVGLNRSHLSLYPHEFSGGQRQRIGIARALILRPKLMILDEPVSALDVSVQAQILNLLKDLQKEYHLTYLFISHDLSVVRHISDRVIVMYLGKVVEIAEKHSLYKEPNHPYSKILLSSVPIPNPRITRNRILVEGDLPSPTDPPTGCVFHPRCPMRIDKCSQIQPQLKEIKANHFSACLLNNKD